MSIFPDSSKTEILYKKDAGFTVTQIGTDLTQENPVSSSKLTWGQFVPDAEPTDLTPMTFTQTGNSFVSKSYSIEYPYLVKYTMLQLTTTIQPDTSYTIYASDYLDTSTFTNETDVNLLANPITKYGFEVSVYSNSSDNVIRTTSKILQSNTTITWYYDTDNGVLLFLGDKTLLGYGNPFITFWRYEGTYETEGSGTTGPTGTIGMTTLNNWFQTGEDINGTSDQTQFGYSVSLSEDGTIVAVGEPYNTISTPNGRCRIYNSVLVNGITEWVQLGGDINGINQNQLGRSVSLSSDGKTVAIGEPINNINNASYAGRCGVYTYGLTGGTTGWFRIGQNINGEYNDDKSGISVSLSGDGRTVAIGAINNRNVTSTIYAGQCRVYKYGLTGVTGTTGWVKVGQDIDGYYDAGQFGFSVSLSQDGKNVAVGARYSSTGYSRIYKVGLTGGTGTTGWIKIGQDINGEYVSDQSGYSVSLSGNGTIVAIGAPYNRGSSQFDNDTGQCRVYKVGLTGVTGTTGWIQLGQDIDGQYTTDLSGLSVSLSTDGTKVAIGAPGKSRCRIYQYGLTGGTGTTGWIQQGQDIDGETANDNSGWSVSLSGDGTSVAIGAPTYNSSKGQCRVYKIRSKNTIIDGYVTLDGDTEITGNTIIGGTGTTTTLNGSNLYVNSPMITNYSYGTNGTGIVNSIGYIYRGTFASKSFTSTSDFKITGIISDVPPGVYVVNSSMYFFSQDTSVQVQTQLNVGNVTTDPFASSKCLVNTNVFVNMTGIIYLNEISTIYHHSVMDGIGQNANSDFILRAVRIA